MKYSLLNYAADCPRCKTADSNHLETIERNICGVLMTFDVSRAIRLATSKTPIDLPNQIRDMLISVGSFDESHVWHVDHKYPGIIVALENGIFMIDGHHRAERCRRLEKPFKAFLFSADETESDLAVPSVLES